MEDLQVKVYSETAPSSIHAMGLSAWAIDDDKGPLCSAFRVALRLCGLANELCTCRDETTALQTHQTSIIST